MIRPQLLYKTQTRWLFHSHIKLKFSVFCDDELFSELYSVLENVDNLYNSYSGRSFIHRINAHSGHFVEVDDETVHILRQVKLISGFFDGEYDITVMPLVRLWGFYKEHDRTIPSQEQINKAKELVGYQSIEIDGTQVRIGKGQEIITGSFIKAYAVDKMIERMHAMGITDAIVNAGGSTIMALADDSHPYWEIAVKHPENNADLFTVNLANKCFSTSAQSKTFVEINGEKYGHIISPKTGYPSANKQIGIISDNCFVGDMVSTGLFNLSGEQFIEKMKQLSSELNVEGFMIDKHDVSYYSERFKQYIN